MDTMSTEEQPEKMYAPLRVLSAEEVATLPRCLYQTGWLKEGETVYPCPRCTFVFNSTSMPPKCANCGLQAIEAPPPRTAPSIMELVE